MESCLESLVRLVGTRTACLAVGRSRATHYRRKRPAGRVMPRTPRPAPKNKLTDAERDLVLAVLDSERFCDCSPAQVFYTLLDEGTYLASQSSFYRLLRERGQSGERRRQASHPPRVRPELVACCPNRAWSWDITKLKGPKRGEYYDCYVILDIFSRYVVAWLVAPSESGELAKALIEDAVTAQGVKPGELTIHADRGSSMTSNPVTALYELLGIGRSHSRPHVSNDNPYSESQFKTMRYCPAFPERFGRSKTPAGSARTSPPTTTTTTATPGSATTRRPRCAAAPPPRCASSGARPSPPPTRATLLASATATPSRRSCRASPGSTSPSNKKTNLDRRRRRTVSQGA